MCSVACLLQKVALRYQRRFASLTQRVGNSSGPRSSFFLLLGMVSRPKAAIWKFRRVISHSVLCPFTSHFSSRSVLQHCCVLERCAAAVALQWQ